MTDINIDDLSDFLKSLKYTHRIPPFYINIFLLCTRDIIKLLRDAIRLFKKDNDKNMTNNLINRLENIINTEKQKIQADPYYNSQTDLMDFYHRKISEMNIYFFPNDNDNCNVFKKPKKLYDTVNKRTIKQQTRSYSNLRERTPIKLQSRPHTANGTQSQPYFKQFTLSPNKQTKRLFDINELIYHNNALLREIDTLKSRINCLTEEISKIKHDNMLIPLEKQNNQYIRTKSQLSALLEKMIHIHQKLIGINELYCAEAIKSTRRKITQNIVIADIASLLQQFMEDINILLGVDVIKNGIIKLILKQINVYIEKFLLANWYKLFLIQKFDN
jgi:hypothetical protein